MRKKTFTDKEIKSLSKNPYVKSISSKGNTYTDEFKRHFISENEKGKSPREIFETCGFDLEVLGVASGKCGITTIRKFQNKKPNFSTN